MRKEFSLCRAGAAGLVTLVWMMACRVEAGPRTSAAYTVATDIADAGGKRSISASYTNDGSAGGASGIATVASPSETAKNGYLGQLYEVTALQISASPTTVNEGATRQLAATQLLDDLTTIVVPVGSITWSVQNGPITGINTSGLVTAGTVYQNTLATAQGSFAGNSGTLGLTVVNVNIDDYGTYAGDGLDDAWQVQYFGQPPNAHAAPSYVSDGSGLTNLFKYTAGLVPNNAASTFSVLVQPVAGQPAQRNIVFNPSLTDRHYTVLSSSDIISWTTVSGPFLGNGGTQTVTDTGAGTTRKFYRVQISKP